MSNEKRAALAFGMIAFLGILLVFDLINQGRVWQLLQTFRSPNNGSLPGEKRTVGGDGHQTDVTFLS